jgi:hypothetical protein
MPPTRSKAMYSPIRPLKNSAAATYAPIDSVRAVKVAPLDPVLPEARLIQNAKGPCRRIVLNLSYGPGRYRKRVG